MTPELQNALLGFLVVVLAAAGTVVTGVGLYLKASFENRVKKMAVEAEAQRLERENKIEEDRQNREHKRTIEMEEMRQKTAVAQAAADQAQALGENLVNLNTTIIKLIDSSVAENHANRGVLANQAESMGFMGQSIDRMATNVNENTIVTRATGSKADNVVSAVQRLEQVMSSGVREIITLLQRPTTIEANVTMQQPADTADTADGEAAA